MDVSSPRDWKILNGATSQTDRIASAPAPDQVQVDGRGIPQLLAFAARYGALIRFYDLADRPNGDWSDFFASDPAIAEAVQGALDLPEIESALRALLALAREATDNQTREPPLRRVLATIVRLLSILDRAAPTGTDHAAQLQSFTAASRRDGLAEPLGQLQQHMERRSARDDRTQQGPWFDMLIELIEDVLAALIAALQRDAAAALAASDAALGTSGHAPQAALWNAFVVLFDEARQEMNRFPHRLLDFYYGEILGQHSIAAQPATVFLTFTLAQGAAQASIPKRTAFSAGTDSSGTPITYAASTSLAVSPVSITNLSVHRYSYDNAGQPTGVWSGTVGPPQNAGPGGFPLFGAIKPDPSDSLTMTPASLGFVVANPTLLLTGGTRLVNITLTPGTGAQKLFGATPDPSASLVASMQDAFDFWYSTAGGWMAVQGVSVTASTDTPGAVLFSFTLPADAPPMVPVTTQPSPGAPSPTRPASAFSDPGGQPAIIAQLIQDASGTSGGVGSDAFALLQKVDVTAISVSVTVSGLPPASLSNRGGLIDQTQSFAVFGPAPAQYDALDVSAPELFVKPLSSLSISIAWVGLPVTSTGFEGYYKNYVLNADGEVSPTPLFNNASFKVAFSVVTPGSWTVDAQAQPYLFQTTPPPPPTGQTAISTVVAPPMPSSPVLPVSVLTVPGVTAQTPPTYYNPASSTLRLSMVAPNYTFGSVLYASNVTRISAENVAALRAGGSGNGASAQSAASARLSEASTANATTPDRGYAKSIGTTVEQAISSLNGLGFTQLQQAITATGATPAAKSAWQQTLTAALGGNGDSSLWSRLKTALGASGLSTVTTSLQAWAAAHEGDLLTWGGSAVQQAKATLAAAEAMAATSAAAGKQSTAAARTSMAAALQQAQGAVGTATDDTVITPLPNPPWIPTASAVTLGYTVSATVYEAPLATQVATLLSATAAPATQGPLAPSGTTTTHGTPSAQGAPAKPATPTPRDARWGPSFLHLSLFDSVAPASPRPPFPMGAACTPAAPLAALPVAQMPTPAPTAGATLTIAAASPAPPATPLLPPITGRAALYIELSAPVDEISLLFVLTAGPDGWSNDGSTLTWEKEAGNQWLPVDVVGDTTNNLHNSGIVVLNIASPGAAKDQSAQRVRVVQTSTTNNPAYVLSVTTNALAAVWAGPGGAAQLGTPLPAGTIKQSVNTVAGLGTIVQPMDSVGGTPPARGAPFDKWMAEHLRHKGFAIDGWDYARLVLAGIPTLWQLAVVPPADDGSGDQAPGDVWVVAVAGPNTPNVSDPTIPAVAPSVLQEIGDLLQPVVSPFAVLKVTNPPYLRLKVVARCAFSDADTPGFWIALLGSELVRWLSPWPDPAFGQRPPDYTSRQAVAEFVRGRYYVQGILSLQIVPERDPAKGGWHYLTSALQHSLKSADESATSKQEAAT